MDKLICIPVEDGEFCITAETISSVEYTHGYRHYRSYDKRIKCKHVKEAVYGDSGELVYFGSVPKIRTVGKYQWITPHVKVWYDNGNTLTIACSSNDKAKDLCRYIVDVANRASTKTS